MGRSVTQIPFGNDNKKSNDNGGVCGDTPMSQKRDMRNPAWWFTRRMGASVKQILSEDDNKKSKSAVCAAILSVSLVSLTGCGYHQVGAATHIPTNVRVLDVPIFQSKVQAFNTETLFTGAVVRELNTRTRYQIVSGAEKTAADATLRGTILAETIAPLTYDATSGQTSSYLVSVTTKVELVAHDGTVLYSNDAFAWRQQYQSTQDLSGFVQEDSAAVRRMAHDFAGALVSDMLESFK